MHKFLKIILLSVFFVNFFIISNPLIRNIVSSKITSIHKGTKVDDINDYPFVVSVLDSSEKIPYIASFCGGSIIGTKYVMTAAHCVTDLKIYEFFAGLPFVVEVTKNPSELEIGFGSSDLLSSNTKRLKVSKVFVHPKYNSKASSYDYAILELVNPVAEENVLPILDDPKLLLAGDDLSVIGWGRVNDNQLNEKSTVVDLLAIHPRHLQEADITLFSNKECRKVYGSSFNTKTMMCAADLVEKDNACKGDSGGPLLMEDSNGDLLLVGLVSFAKGGLCSDDAPPVVYARVSSVVNWIDGIISSQ